MPKEEDIGKAATAAASGGAAAGEQVTRVEPQASDTPQQPVYPAADSGIAQQQQSSAHSHAS